MRPRRIALGAALVCLVATATLASTVMGLSIEDQARLSKMVIAGEVVAQEGVLHPENGLETAVTLRVTQSLKGKARPGQDVVFHTRGGELDGTISQALGEAVLRTGQEYLVFVEDVDGRLYNVGLSMGVWEVTEGADGKASYRRALQDGLEVLGDVQVERGPISMREMGARVSDAQRRPEFDHPLLRETFGLGRR